MAIFAVVTVRLSFVPDGAGPMEVPTAQSLVVGNPLIPYQLCPGGNTASAANLATLATSIGTAVGTAFTTGTIQAQVAGWGTGGQ